MVGDTVELVAFYRDSAGDPIGSPRPAVTWASSDEAILQVLSSGLGLAADTGRVTLTARTVAAPIDSARVQFEVITRWTGHLVWDRAPDFVTQLGIAFQDLPRYQVVQLPDLGYPGETSGDPYLSSDGRFVAAIATRPIAPAADRTIYIVDLLTGIKTSPFDSVPGKQIAPVWFRGDTLLAFLMATSTGYEVFTSRPDGSERVQRTQLHQLTPPIFDLTPDNHLVIALRLAGNVVDLMEMTLAGDSLRRLTQGPGDENQPAVSPDGNMIAYSLGSDVWVMRRDGSDARRLLPHRRVLLGSGPPFHAADVGSTSPSWSPDGKFVLVDWTPDTWWTVLPQLQPDSVFLALPELYAIRVNDGLAVRLTRHPASDMQPFFR
jgi:hypothetical protein